MADARYYCRSARRRDVVRGSSSINGIDHVEVDASQTRLRVVFIHDLPGTGAGAVPPAGQPLGVHNVAVVGGVRVPDPEVVSVAATGSVLDVEVASPGDFSRYVLRLQASSTDPDPPAGFDPRLAAVEFSFKATCASGLDCVLHQHCPPEHRDEPEIDYLAKDYDSFRRLMLERLAVVTPEWEERSPADLQVALVELLAYLGDRLSYQQDAVATEAYLRTARRRVSVRRHARYLDYFMHEGCNARTWLVFDVAAPLTLPAGSPVFTGAAGDDTVVHPADLPRLVRETAPIVFETLTPAGLRPQHHEIDFYTWSDDHCCLPVGSTAATLTNEPSRSIEKGDVLVFEEVLGPTTGLAADADPTHRHAVRLTDARPGIDPVTGDAVLDIEWSAADQLPFPLCLTAQVVSTSGAVETVVTSVARANVVLADHGYTPRSDVTGEPDPEALPEIPDAGRYRPLLLGGPVTVRGPFDPAAPAAESLRCTPSKARPAVTLDGDGRVWRPVFDLLASDRFEPDFVVEFETDRTARLRFGDGVFGLAPTPGDQLRAHYRVGSGPAGNVGADQLVRVAFTGAANDIVAVRNPLPAAGGVDPEAMDRVRYAAPQAMRTQERAVTEDDYADKAADHPQVQDARARFRWTGSWHTVFVAVDPVGGGALDDAVASDLRRRLDALRMMGQDVRVAGPTCVPLDVALRVCVAPGHYRSDVALALADVLGSRVLPDGRRGVFHPDNFTFGQPVYLSSIYEAALGVAGVATVSVTRFQRYGEVPRGELEAAVIQPADLEIVRLDNDPSSPEMGQLDLVFEGGL